MEPVTNLLVAITSWILVTNTTVEVPKIRKPAACPGWPHCTGPSAVHAIEGAVPFCVRQHQYGYDDPEATNRTRITTVTRYKLFSVPELGIHQTNGTDTVRQEFTVETREPSWKQGPTEVRTNFNSGELIWTIGDFSMTNWTR